MPFIELLYPTALFGLLLILPIIILYLMKPKPKKMRFPSVMFILDTERKRRLRTFLKKVIRDPLLVLQILIITLLVSAIAGPYILAPAEESMKETAVIILDSSASMQATDMGTDRFARATQLAEELIAKMNPDSRISIVLAENVPIILAKNASRRDAAQYLDKAFNGDTPSTLADSIIFSKDLFSPSDFNKKVYVVSDFCSAEPTEIRLAQKVLSQSNISMKYLKVKGGGRNIGITEAKAKRFLTDRTSFYTAFAVQNYMDSEKEVEADIFIDGKSAAKLSNTIPAGSEKLFTYEGGITEGAHTIEARIVSEDALSVDDTAYMFLPEVKKYSVLLITDEESDRYLRYALESSKDVELTTTVLPVLPGFEGFDIIILGNINQDFLLPGTFRDLRVYAEDGGHVVILSSEALAEYDSQELEKLLPVEIKKTIKRYQLVTVLQNHEILTDIVPKGADSMPNVLVEKYLESKEKNGTTVIAIIIDSPVLSYQQLGKGKVAYIGVNPNPNWSNFYLSSNFPVFWIQLINWMTRDESTLGVNNFRTGDYLPVTEGTQVMTPSGDVLTARNLILDETGFYEFMRGGIREKVAVSLLDAEESDISNEVGVDSLDPAGLTLGDSGSLARKELVQYIVLMILAIIAIEAYYYRRRGVL